MSLIERGFPGFDEGEEIAVATPQESTFMASAKQGRLCTAWI